MTEPQVTMIECPDCGMPIRASREYECDPAKAIAIDRLMADLNRKTELAGALRCTCARLRKMRDAQKTLAGRLNARGDKLEGVLYRCRSRCEELEKERDKALTRCEELQSLLDVSMDGNQELWWRERQERDEAREWARKMKQQRDSLRAQLAKAECDLFYQKGVQVRAESMAGEIDDLRAQLATARNDALDEAGEATRFALFIRDMPFETIHHVSCIINKLKDSAGAYPADEISTVAEVQRDQVGRARQELECARVDLAINGIGSIRALKS